MAVVTARPTVEGERVEGVDRRGPVYPLAGTMLVTFPDGSKQLLDPDGFAARFQPVAADPDAPSVADLQATIQAQADEIALLKLQLDESGEDDDDSDVEDDSDEDEEE